MFLNLFYKPKTVHKLLFFLSVNPYHVPTAFNTMNNDISQLVPTRNDDVMKLIGQNHTTYI